MVISAQVAKRKLSPFLSLALLLQLSCSAREEPAIVNEVEGPIKVNCYLLYGPKSKEAAIFDAAGPLDDLTAFVREKGLRVRYIFLTHAHWDHIEGIFELTERFPEAKVGLSREEFEAMQDYTKFARESDPERFEKIMQDPALAKMVGVDLSSVKPDILVKDNEQYKLGKLVIRTIFSPGHSAGSMCYSCGSILFSGDVLFKRSVGNTDFYKGSKKDQVGSVRRLYRLFPDDTIVYPGHGEPTDIGSEKKENTYVSATGGALSAR
jgi:hydroxyacylglutathione hydrolase